MELSQKVFHPIILAQALALGLMAEPLAAPAQEFKLESAGSRLGFSAKDGENFRQAEAFVDLNLPWNWNLGREWRLQTRLDISAGALRGNGRVAALATAGPLLALNAGRLPLSVEGGSGATILSRDHFESKDFGIPFQFTSHVGLYWDFAPHLRLGYRFQHMSNAGLGSPNPGLNMHVLVLGWTF